LARVKSISLFFENVEERDFPVDKATLYVRGINKTFEVNAGITNNMNECEFAHLIIPEYVMTEELKKRIDAHDIVGVSCKYVDGSEYVIYAPWQGDDDYVNGAVHTYRNATTEEIHIFLFDKTLHPEYINVVKQSLLGYYVDTASVDEPEEELLSRVDSFGKQEATPAGEDKSRLPESLSSLDNDELLEAFSQLMKIISKKPREDNGEA